MDIKDVPFKLYKIKEYDPSYILLRKIYEECQKKELTLSRWECNSTITNYIKTITWGIHRGERKKTSKGSNLIYKITLRNPEGKTERSEAYTKFMELYNQIKEN